MPTRHSPSLPTAITTERDWLRFVHYMLDHCGLAFHPDTPVGSYVDLRTDRPLFDPQTTIRLDDLLSQAISHIPASSLYDLAFEMMCRRYPAIGADFSP